MVDVLALRDAGRLLVDSVGDYWEILPESDRVIHQNDNWKADGTEHVLIREVPHAGSTGAAIQRGPRGVYEVMLWSGTGGPGLQAGALIRALVRPAARWYEEAVERIDTQLAQLDQDEAANDAEIARLEVAPPGETARERVVRERELAGLIIEADRLTAERAQLQTDRQWNEDARAAAEAAGGEIPAGEVEGRVEERQRARLSPER